MQTVIIIPARLESTRLPNKPIKDIAGFPMIIQVAKRAQESGIADVFIATGNDEIIDIAKQYGFDAIKTFKSHESGSDRVFEAYENLPNHEKYDYIVNLQGDLPNIEPDYIKKTVELLENGQADIATLATIIDEQDIRTKNNPNIVKIIASDILKGKYAGHRALYFTRSNSPYGEGIGYSHIGIYCYRKQALQKFVKLQPSPLELREKLEQLRALENDMTISFSIVEKSPISVDTKDDLERVREFFALSLMKK